MEQAIQTYHDTILMVKEMFEDMRFNRELRTDRICEQATQIVDIVSKSSNPFSLLQHLRDVELYRYTHPIDVAIISVMLGKWLKLTDEDVYHLACAGLVHDIGKAKIPDSVLNKTIELNEREMEIVRDHTNKGYELVNQIPDFHEGIKLAVQQHHERHDGSGYPLGLEGSEIHLYARIIAVADIFDAMTANRGYTSKIPIYKVIKEINAGSYGSLDPLISQGFLKCVESCSIGAKVMLSNNLIGEVIYANPTSPNRPIVKADEQYIDLSRQIGIEIIDFL